LLGALDALQQEVFFAVALRTVRDDLRAWNLNRVIWVVDRGFTSAGNRRYLQRAGGHYVMGEKLPAGSAEAAVALARAGRYHPRREPAGQGGAGSTGGGQPIQRRAQRTTCSKPLLRDEHSLLSQSLSCRRLSATSTRVLLQLCQPLT
jgi:hypothetical protein